MQCVKPTRSVRETPKHVPHPGIRPKVRASHVCHPDTAGVRSPMAALRSHAGRRGPGSAASAASRGAVQALYTWTACSARIC